jgi:hypothetical protein
VSNKTHVGNKVSVDTRKKNVNINNGHTTLAADRDG